MNINNKVIDNHLKFESERFRNECLNIYKTLVDGNIKTAIQNSYDELYKKIDSELKNNIMKSIGGKDLYDYSEIHTPEILEYVNERSYITNNYNNITREKFSSFKTINDTFEGLYLFNKNEIERRYAGGNDWNYYQKQLLHINNIKEKFGKLILNERLILGYCNIKYMKIDKYVKCNRNGELLYDDNSDDITGHNGIKIKIRNYIFLTNFGRLVKYTYYHHSENNGIYTNTTDFDIKNSSYIEFDFWIPTDYIRILQLTKPDNIEEVLKCMKDTLYNRKIVPLYVKDIVERNEVLESKYEEYEKGNEKYIKDKEEFEKETKPYVDLYKDKEDLHKLREELKLEKEKLKLVAIKLEMDKKKFEEDMAMIKDMNISDIFRK